VEDVQAPGKENEKVDEKAGKAMIGSFLNFKREFKAFITRVFFFSHGHDIETPGGLT